MKTFLSHFVVILGTLSSIATLIAFVLDKELFVGTIQVLVGLGILSISIIYAIYQSRSKKKIILEINSNLKLIVQQADLFKQNGVIVIGFNEYFDTYVGDGVVSPDSLHGIFINKYFKDHLSDLDRGIKESLESQNIKPIQTGCQRKNIVSKKDKYPLGTCAMVHDGGNKYVLVALTHFDQYDKANLSRSEFNDVLAKLMSFLEKNAQDTPVHMPILGTGLARLDRSESRILHFILDNLDFLYAVPLIGGLYIDILSLKKAGISLNNVENHFKNGIKESN